MRRHDLVLQSSGNFQVSRKQDTYYLEIKEDFSKLFSLKNRRLSLSKKAANWLKIKMSLHSKCLKQRRTKTSHYFF